MNSFKERRGVLIINKMGNCLNCDSLQEYEVSLQDPNTENEDKPAKLRLKRDIYLFSFTGERFNISTRKKNKAVNDL